MNKLVYLLFFTIIGGNLHAQGTSEPKYLREANIAFESGKYFEAIDKLNTAYDKIGTKGSLKEKGMFDLSLLNHTDTFLDTRRPMKIMMYVLS